MVYKLIQYILRLYLPVFFKRLEFRGLDNIPQDKPVIFAVNHQNAFLDGILVALKQRRPIFFLTRSDVFKGKGLVKFFKIINLIPIFRAKTALVISKPKIMKRLNIVFENLKRESLF